MRPAGLEVTSASASGFLDLACVFDVPGRDRDLSDLAGVVASGLALAEPAQQVLDARDGEEDRGRAVLEQLERSVRAARSEPEVRLDDLDGGAFVDGECFGDVPRLDRDAPGHNLPASPGGWKLTTS